MVTKKSSSKKSSAKKATSKKRTTKPVSMEKAVKKSVEQGIQNNAKKAMNEHKNKNSCKTGHSCGHVGGSIWFLGFVGATVYYISTATGFWNAVWGVLKALVWPAIVVFKLLAM